MTRADLKRAISMAVSTAVLPEYLSEDLHMFEGFGNHNRRILATIEQFAGLVRGQAVMMADNGHTRFDAAGMSEIEELYKRVDLV